MSSLSVSNYKLKDNVSLQKDEPAIVSSWNNRSVELLTKAAFVCGAVLAGSVFATASAIYSKVISGMFMLGFAALAVARWISPPIVNRVSIPENTNQAVEAQPTRLDHESEDTSMPSASELPWYKDGKKVAGAAAGATALAGLSILAYYRLSNQETISPPLSNQETISPPWSLKGLVSPAPFERPMLSNTGIDDRLSYWSISRAEATKSFVKHLPLNSVLFSNQFPGPCFNALAPADKQQMSPMVTRLALALHALDFRASLRPLKQYKLCAGRNPQTSKLERCKSVTNPLEVDLQGTQELCEVVRTEGNKWKPLNCTISSQARAAEEFLDNLSSFLEKEKEDVAGSWERLESSSVYVKGLFASGKQRLLSDS